MLKKELLTKDSKTISDFMSFWGLDKGQTWDEIITKITCKSYFSLHLGKLDIHELRCLFIIFYAGGVCLKSGLAEKYQDEQVLESALASLEKKLYIYVRKDRRLLTDKYDKIYLFPEIHEVLKSFQVYNKVSLKKYLKNLLPSGFTISDNRNDKIEEIITYGGFFPVREEERSGFQPLYDKGLIEIVLFQDPPLFLPIWIITDKALKVVAKKPENVHFRPSLYLNNLINIIDCLLYRGLSRKNVRRVTSICIKTVQKGSGEDQKYIKELYSLKVFEEKDGALTVNGDFAKLSYEDKVMHLKSLLTANERSVLGMIRRKKLCSKLWAVSSMMMEYVADNVYRGKKPAELRKVLEEYNDALTSLIFRGFILQDFEGSYVKANVMERSSPTKGTVVVNTDRQILVYTDCISHFVLYVLTGFSHVEHFGPIMRLTIDRDSIARGIEYICDVDFFSTLLQHSARGEVDGAIDHLIREWSSSVKRIDVQNCWMVQVDSQETKLRLYQNKYFQSAVAGETDSVLLLKRDIDIARLRKELRKENIFLHIQTG